MGARTIFILLSAVFLYFQRPAFATDSLDFNRVCELLLKREGVGIFVSRDGYDVNKGRHKKNLMANIPFGRLLQTSNTTAKRFFSLNTQFFLPKPTTVLNF